MGGGIKPSIKACGITLNHVLSIKTNRTQKADFTGSSKSYVGYKTNFHEGKLYVKILVKNGFQLGKSEPLVFSIPNRFKGIFRGSLLSRYQVDLVEIIITKFHLVFEYWCDKIIPFSIVAFFVCVSVTELLYRIC
jgi:hypothetical protein